MGGRPDLLTATPHSESPAGQADSSRSVDQGATGPREHNLRTFPRRPDRYSILKRAPGDSCHPPRSPSASTRFRPNARRPSMRSSGLTPATRRQNRQQFVNSEARPKAHHRTAVSAARSDSSATNRSAELGGPFPGARHRDALLAEREGPTVTAWPGPFAVERTRGGKSPPGVSTANHVHEPAIRSEPVRTRAAPGPGVSGKKKTRRTVPSVKEGRVYSFSVVSGKAGRISSPPARNILDLPAGEKRCPHSEKHENLW